MSEQTPTPAKQPAAPQRTTPPVTKVPRKARAPRPVAAPEPKDTPAPKKRNPWVRAFRGLLLALDILALLLLCASAYNGYISPEKYGGYWGLLGLAFPIILAATGLLLLLQLLVWRLGALIPLLALIICGGPILNYCPLHIFNPKPAPGARTFKLMTYNILSFKELHPEQNLDSPRNRTMNTIIESGADIVCLQETEIFGPYGDNKIHAEDMSLLNKIYPHIIRTGYYIVLLSKYPVEAIHLDVSRRDLGCDLGAYRVDLGDRQITIFNAHLQSLGLTSHDLNIYRDLTHGKTREISEIREVKSSLLSKVAAANVSRARQADKLARYIEHYGGPNVIVCGDFNDVANCYTIRRLADLRMREVYPEVGFGPIITYNARRLYFGIDHVLWRGDMRPLNLVKGTIPSSDHFPLTVEFELQ